MTENGDQYGHLQTSCTKMIDGKPITITFIPSSRHPELYNPVVRGFVHRTQKALGSTDKCLGICIHGDAAITGQGVVYESL